MVAGEGAHFETESGNVSTKTSTYFRGDIFDDETQPIRDTTVTISEAEEEDMVAPSTPDAPSTGDNFTADESSNFSAINHIVTTIISLFAILVGLYSYKKRALCSFLICY